MEIGQDLHRDIGLRVDSWDKREKATAIPSLSGTAWRCALVSKRGNEQTVNVGNGTFLTEHVSPLPPSDSRPPFHLGRRETVSPPLIDKLSFCMVRSGTSIRKRFLKRLDYVGYVTFN